MEGAGVKLISVVSSHRGKADMPCGHQSTYHAPCFGVLQLKTIRSRSSNYETSLKRLLNIPEAAEANLELSNLSNSPHSH